MIPFLSTAALSVRLLLRLLQYPSWFSYIESLSLSIYLSYEFSANIPKTPFVRSLFLETWNNFMIYIDITPKLLCLAVNNIYLTFVFGSTLLI